jgi:thioredoxin 1
MNKQILYFSASWCGPCKNLNPIINQLQTEGVNIKKIDIDNDFIISQNYSIKNIPTLVLVDSRGTEIKRITGSKSKEDIKNWYNG